MMTVNTVTKLVVVTTVVVVVVVVAAAVTIENVAVRLGVPEGEGLSGVCLYRYGPDKRRHVMFKSVGSTARERHDGGGEYAVAGDLAADRVYEGTFARLGDGDQVARFGCDRGQRFEIATPFVVPARDVDAMLAVKESMERRLGARPQRSVTAEHVSVTLRGLMSPAAGSRGEDDDGGAVTVDVFRLYKKPSRASDEGNGSARAAPQYSAYPYARYALRRPVGNLMLADLPPDQMLAVKFRRSVPVADNSVFIYTGGLYPRGTANLTEMLDGRPRPDDDGDTDTAASSHRINAQQAPLYRDSYGKNPSRLSFNLSAFSLFLFRSLHRDTAFRLKIAFTSNTRLTYAFPLVFSSATKMFIAKRTGDIVTMYPF